MKTIVFTPAAAKDYDALPGDVQARIDGGLTDYAISGRGDVKKLSGQALYRLRIGRYRVIFDENRTTILAIQIGKRETTTYRRN
jgi:mRNA interferase RelE/StbE